MGWQKLFERFPEIEAGMPEPHLRVGDDVAWVTGEELFRARRSSGEAVEVALLATSVFEKSGNKWLMVYHHVSVAAPPPNPPGSTGAAARRRSSAASSPPSAP